MVIIVMSNSNKISFYVANYFELLFSLTFNYKMFSTLRARETLTITTTVTIAAEGGGRRRTQEKLKKESSKRVGSWGQFCL